jgi:tetratricopeptide (TPR) repeat protein
MTPFDRPAISRWLVVGSLVLVALAALWHAILVEQQLRFAASVSFNNTPAETPFQRVRPGFTADASMWIRYSTEALEGTRPLRSHFTNVDNAPDGREVHWNTGLIAWLAACGWATHQVTGWTIPHSVERAAVFANWPLFALFLVIFSWWTWRRAGPLAAVALATACFGQRWYYEGFLPSYLDHHGLVSAAVAGLLLGILFMGAGWIRPAGATDDRLGTLLPDNESLARSAARWSGFWGGFGMWISTASMVIPITIVSFGTLLTALACRAQLRGTGIRFAPAVWRTWGRVGALTSFAFYLLEYFPSQLGWRLEVNHPLYALAWWAGAELLASALELIAAEPAERRALLAPALRRAAWAAPLVVLPLGLIAVRGSEVFILADSFVARLHNSIGEFLPMGVRMQGRSFGDFMEIVGWKLTVPFIGLGLLLVTRRRPPLLLLLATFVAVLMIALGLFWQARWGTLAASAELPALLAVLATFDTFRLTGSTFWRRLIVTAAIAGFCYVASIVELIVQQQRVVAAKLIPPDVALEVVNRDIAAVLRRSMPEGTIVLFTNPNASVSVGYYGRFITTGTLYWENHAGLRTAAELICAPTDEAAEAIIRRHGITHIAVISEENFVLGYAKLLQPDITMERLRTLFGARLLARNIPVWLEPLIYTAPRNLPAHLATLEVDLYKVNFQQSFAQAYLNGANLFASRNNLAGAIEMLGNCARFAPQDPLPLKLRGGLYLRTQQWDAALADFRASVALLPEAQRSAGWTEAALALTQFARFAAAVECYERAVALDPTNTIALNNLTWRLAVAADDAVRRPAQALQLAERLVAAVPSNAIVFDTYAAALAANGRLEDAVVASSRAIALAQGNPEWAKNIGEYQQRLARYTSGQAWRE